MNRDTLDRFCERGILGLVLAMLVFGPLSAGAVRMQEFVVLLALTAVVLLLWGVRLWLSERPKLLWPPVCWCVLAFALYAIGRYLTCDIEYVGRLELLRVLVYTALFFAILNNLHARNPRGSSRSRRSSSAWRWRCAPCGNVSRGRTRCPR